MIQSNGTPTRITDICVIYWQTCSSTFRESFGERARGDIPLWIGESCGLLVDHGALGIVKLDEGRCLVLIFL